MLLGYFLPHAQGKKAARIRTPKIAGVGVKAYNYDECILVVFLFVYAAF